MGGKSEDRKTYIWMPSKLLDNSIIEVAGVTKEATSNIECVLHAAEGVIKEGNLRALAQLKLLVLMGGMNVLHPRMVGSSVFMLDMVFELDYV